MSTQHIGIVGVSAEGAALCYRTICIEGEALLGTYGHPEVSMHTLPLTEYMKPLLADDWAQVGEAGRVFAKVGQHFAQHGPHCPILLIKAPPNDQRRGQPGGL